MGDETSGQTNADRALAAYESMQKYLSVEDGTGLYREAYPWRGGNPYSYLWPFSRALVGTLSLAGIPSHRAPRVDSRRAVKDRLVGLAKYWDAFARVPAYDSYVVQPLGQGGDKYFDDNAWVALALVEQHQLGLGESLQRAQQLFDFGTSGWDRRATDPNPGGVFWVQQDTGQGRTNHDRGAGLTAGYAKLGFLLHELTGSSVYDGDGTLVATPRTLGAENMVNWVNTNLDSNRRGSGVYWNVIRRNGSVDTNLWSYVQGEMIGARTLQYRLSGNAEHLQQAEGIARETLATFGTLTRQPPSFNAMCFQALLLLSTLTGDADLRTSMVEVIRAYADWAWNPGTGARDSATNLFHFTADGRPARTSRAAAVQDQGAMVQIYSLLAWDADDFWRLT